MNWDFFDIVEVGMSKGYKSIWAVYEAEKQRVPITLDDIKELGEMYNHKPMWAVYTAQKFGIAPFNKQKKKQQLEKEECVNALQNHFFRQQGKLRDHQ